MKAIVYSDYGSADVLKYEEIEKPVAGDDEVLIKVRAASLNPVDGHLMRAAFPLRLMTRLRKPKNTWMGVDVAGHVEAVGRNVTQFKPGDEVFGACRGAFTEYACVSESRLVMKPNKVTFEQAASVPVAGLTALQGLRHKGKVRLTGRGRRAPDASRVPASLDVACSAGGLAPLMASQRATGN